MIDKIKKNIEINIKSFTKKLKDEIKLDQINPYLYKSILEYSLRKGKRIRPTLLILSYKGYLQTGKIFNPSVYYASTAVEFLHNFMLVHDDIIDNSDLRRSKPTMHKILEKTIKTDDKKSLGINLGIIAGDIIYALAIDAFLSIEVQQKIKQRALQYFLNTTISTAIGEFIDTIHSVDKLQNVKESDVFLNYTLKTAKYTFTSPLVIGAILAGAKEGEINKLTRLGLLIGQAFQIQDDIIGIFDTQKNIGKSILSDLAESKKTLLVAHAYENLKSKDKKLFIDCFNKPKKTYKDLLNIRSIFINSGSLDYCRAAIETRLKEGHKVLDSLKIKPACKKNIETILAQTFRRKN
ncbi:MAG: polyprenyl synthetase family protein [Candidatus Omnitrophica bacterium]|nr:polyprenyl synthetase family protein [Candidatus Omnitrophota bacterium]MBU4334709.1 polyprenyl synthetase family protein [Candidatus Omnitrophota bacterium]